MTRASAGTQLISRNTDEQLLAMARLGDEAAFEAIVGRYRSPLLGHCRRVAGHSCAQDALQQAFLSAWRALRSETDVRDLPSWLFTIAHRSAIRARREQCRQFDELPRTRSGALSPAEDLEQGVRMRETLAALAALPALERDALMSTAVHGRSGRDTARALGVSESALRQLVHRARARTRAAVHVFAPPALLARLSVYVRRTSAPASGCPNALPAETGGMLLKIATVLAAGALVGTQMSASHAGKQKRPSTSRAGAVTRAAGATNTDIVRSPARSLRSASPASLSLAGTRAVTRQGAAAPSPRHGTGAPAPGTSASAARPDVSAAAHSSDAGAARERPAVTHSPAGSQPVAGVRDISRELAEHVTTPVRQLTAPVGQITAPPRQVVSGAVAQLPQTIENATQGTVKTGELHVEGITTDVTQQVLAITRGGLLASRGSAAPAPIGSLSR